MTPDERLEATQFDTFWVPPDVTVVDEEGLLVMHCPRGDTNYNMVLRLRPNGDEEALVARVLALHRGRPSLVPVNSVNASPALLRALQSQGYVLQVRHHAYLCDVRDYRSRSHPGIEGRLVSTLPELRAFMRVSDLAFGKAQVRTQAELDLFLADGNGPRVRRAVAWSDEEPLSAGGITAHPKVGMGFLWGGGTAPRGRYRGAYSAVMEARIAWAATIGLETVGLYARVDTSAPVVASQGFRRHGFMDFWRRA